MEEILQKYSLLNHLNVSRETCLDFEKFISMIVEKNKDINIISKETAKNELIRHRHIIDSAQAIDFVDLNRNTIYDLGTGGGFPGIVIGIMLKNMKKNIKIHLYEKSHHKSSFLREVSRKLNLDIEIIQKNIFETAELNSDTIMARAFKPLPIVMELVYKNFSSYKNLILFMGKSGIRILEETLKVWEFDYEKKKSITNDESFLLNIKNIKKKN
ncbi:class I SAM-dependent methyltransferase [Candidatus Pelagibacter sp.]|jgi:16S rRNA (guanine527-N7)-methyltransferase|nr:class I SAM-dependent methyltransferase [Candidatus Pelagibacter sp.]|tara:strand:- start:1747 stop:2388 length:642 start_codon:yes stop_codon:yes gene_type:complete